MINSARLFDRWGELVYEGTEIPTVCEGIGAQLWDGNFNGKPVNPGVYVYIIEIEFLDGVTLLYRGDVAVIR